jgi:hypothetical protein
MGNEKEKHLAKHRLLWRKEEEEEEEPRRISSQFRTLLS